jgi:hypothetical protein
LKIGEHRHLEWPQIGRSVLGKFLLALPLTLLCDVPNTLEILFVVAKALVCVLLTLVLVLPLRSALPILVLLAVVGRDAADIAVNSSADEASLPSIWLLYLGFIKPSWIIFGCLFVQIAKLTYREFPAYSKPALLWFLSVPIITGYLYGGFGGPESNIEVLVDLKFPIMLLGSLLLFASSFQTIPTAAPTILSILLGGWMARHLVDAAYVFLNIGPEIVEGVSQGSLDSAKGAAVFLAYFGAVIALVGRRVFVGLSIAIISLALIGAYGTRLLGITLCLGTIPLLMLFGLRQRIVIFCVGGALTLLSLTVLIAVNPRAAEFAQLRFATITEGRELNKFAVDVEPNVIARIDPVRYGEFLNVLDTTSDRFSFLWGSGYGSYYEDRAIPFPDIVGQSGFVDYSLASGFFYRVHDFVVHVFFKFGLLGLAAILWLWIRPAAELFSLLRRTRPSAARFNTYDCALRCMVGFLVTCVLQFYWTGKGLFLSGIILALCTDAVRRGSLALKYPASLRDQPRPPTDNSSTAEKMLANIKHDR